MAIVSAEKFVQAAVTMVMQLVDLTQTTLSGLSYLAQQKLKKAPVLIQTSMGAAKYMGGYKVARK